MIGHHTGWIVQPGSKWTLYHCQSYALEPQNEPLSIASIRSCHLALLRGFLVPSLIIIPRVFSPVECYYVF